VGIYSVLYFTDARLRDGDNHEGFVWDCCNGLIWRDDSDVYQWGGHKVLRAERDLIELDVWKCSPALLPAGSV
jgi:hypothetical protein